MFNTDDSDSLAEDETEFETSNPNTSGNQIPRGSPCSCKRDGSQSLRQVVELSSLSSDDVSSVDDIHADTPGLLPTNTDHCNQQPSQQANMLCDSKTSDSSSDSEHGNSLSHTCDRIVTHSVSNGNQTHGDGSTHSTCNSKALKHTRSPFLKTVYTGDNGSAHSGDHLTDQTYGDENASSSSHSSATKITCSPSHSTARPSNQRSTHSHSANTRDKTLSPSHSKLLKRVHSPSHKTAHIGNQISTHGGEHLLSPSQLPEQSHGDGSASSSSLSSTMKTALSPSHRANKQVSAHTHSHDWEHDGSALSNAHTKALKRTHPPSRRMVYSSDKVSTGSHFEKSGGHDDLLPHLQANTSHRTCSSSCKPPCTDDQPSSHSHSTKDDILIQSPPRKTARIDDALVQSQAEDGSACPMTVHSSRKISQNFGPSQCEAEAAAVSSQTSQISLGNLSLILILCKYIHDIV